MKFGRVRAAAIGSALGIFVSGSAGAVTVNIEYKGTITFAINETSGEPIISPFVGQNYTADYVFDLSILNPEARILNSPTDNHVYGGTFYTPSTDSPTLSASITIGAFTGTIPLANSYFGDISAFNNGVVAWQYHDARNADNNVYLINQMFIDGPSSLPVTIDQAFSFSTANNFATERYCDGSVCYDLLANTVTETLATSETHLPATLPLFTTGLGAVGLLGWRRKRKAARQSTRN